MPINSEPTGGSVSLSEELSRLSEKRKVLEQVLSYAHQLMQLQGGIEVVQQMLKASQSPGKATSTVAEYCKKAATMETSALLTMLAKLDKAIASDIEVIVALSTPGSKAAIARRVQSAKHLDSFAALKAKLLDFRRNGEMNIAIRYVLYERGAQLEAAKLPISQNDVAESLSVVREEEGHCRTRLRNDMEKMATDIRALVARPGCPDALKQRLAIVREQLDRNLGMLAQNRSLEELPTTVEVIELSSDEAPIEAPAPVVETAAATPSPATAPASEATAHRRSFWAKLRIWLNSPLKIRWRDIDNYE